MNILIDKKQIKSEGIRFSVTIGGKEAARAFIYLISNELNEKPYALFEDVFVDEKFRGQGLGTKLVETVIEHAREIGCYKLIATSRFEREKVHLLYEKIGFTKHGFEFRIDFKEGKK